MPYVSTGQRIGRQVEAACQHRTPHSKGVRRWGQWYPAYIQLKQSIVVHLGLVPASANSRLPAPTPHRPGSTSTQYHSLRQYRKLRTRSCLSTDASTAHFVPCLKTYASTAHLILNPVSVPGHRIPNPVSVPHISSLHISQYGHRLASA
eukprot:1611124-Rhodomonas_salina.1